MAPDEIMVSTDGSEALQFMFTCGMNPGDEVIVPVSFYANCACFAMLAGARLLIDHADSFCRWMFESFDHNGAKVMMAPNIGFYFTPGAGV